MRAEDSRARTVDAQETTGESRTLENLVSPIVDAHMSDDVMNDDDDEEFGQDMSRDRWTERIDEDEQGGYQEEEEELHRRYSEVFGQEVGSEVEEGEADGGQRGLSQNQGVGWRESGPNDAGGVERTSGASAQRGTGANEVRNEAEDEQDRGDAEREGQIRRGRTLRAPQRVSQR